MGVSIVFENKSIKTDVSGVNSGAYFSLDAFVEIMLATMNCIRIEKREAQVTQFKFDIPLKGRAAALVYVPPKKGDIAA